MKPAYHPTTTLQTAQTRAEMLGTIRQFFSKKNVLEVQTPVLSQAGNTDVFVPSVSANVTVNDRPQPYYLHTSPEFAMKRLLASWQVPMYQICPVFRDNEIGSRHNVEFTMLEWYRPNFSLTQLSQELAELLSEIFGYGVIFNHYSYSQAFLDFVGIHPLTTSVDVLAGIAEDKGINVNKDFSPHPQDWLDLLFSHLVEPHLGHDLPTLITDYPPATASLAKLGTDSDGNEVSKRFELYMNGLEIANAYDELADGEALRQRFEADNAERVKRGLPIMPIDENLLSACDELPDCSGIALGVDRLLMVLIGAKRIDEVISFGIERA